MTDNMLSALVGAIVGAVVAHILDAVRERRRSGRAAQRAILGEVVLLHAEMKATLTELQHAVGLNGQPRDESAVRSSQASLTRLEGRAAQLMASVIPAYTDPRVRAAFDKLRSRFRNTKSLLLRTPPPSVHLCQRAHAWIDEQAEQFVTFASPPAHVAIADRPRLIWIGAGRTASKRWVQKHDSMVAADRMPPWEPEVRLFLRDLPNESTEAREMCDWAFGHIASLRCATHERAPHVTLHGLKLNFTIEVDACCQALVSETLAALPGARQPIR